MLGNLCVATKLIKNDFFSGKERDDKLKKVLGLLLRPRQTKKL